MNPSQAMAGLLFNLMFSCGVNAQEIRIDDGTKSSAQMFIGRGVGVMECHDGSIHLEGTPHSFDKYSENTIEDAAVFDYKLPVPVAMPAADDKIGLSTLLRDSDKNNSQFKIRLRLLVSDKRGGVWAVATRFSGVELPHGGGPVPIETFPYTTSELGRLDPWVMTSLDPTHYDDYDAPQAPLKLVGFRLIVQGNPDKTFSVDLQKARFLAGADSPSPYWLMTPETIWNLRNHQPYAGGGNYGWGPDHAVPNLKASDLGLDAGRYYYSWEILDLMGEKTLAGKMGEATVADTGDQLMVLPLLSKGTYHLRVAVRKSDEKTFHEFFLNYVVVRDSGGRSAPVEKIEKALSLDGLEHSVFERGHLPQVKVTADPALTTGHDSKIVWSVSTADVTDLKAGEAPGEQGLSLDFNSLAKGQSTLWLNARLVVDGFDTDVIHRVTGIASSDVMSPPTGGDLKQPIKDIPRQISRTKADWSEGYTPLITEFEQTKALLGPWLQEGRQTGYNTVELSATWYDLNPLPGVYQFQYLDRLVEMAKEQNLRVVLRIHPSPDLVPLWVPREYQENPQGLAHGLWYGSNILVYSASSTAFAQALWEYATALAAHYRDNPTVQGYSLSSLYFDHDQLDSAWNDQNVDYSDAAVSGFQNYVRARYANLARINAAYGSTYQTWANIVPPLPKPEFDSAGRLMPRLDGLWYDWINYKVDAVKTLRLGEVEALRAGDPKCWIGIYASETTGFYQKEIEDDQCWMACGSMESQFPIGNFTGHGRFEPIGKIARTAELVDVGLSNILLQAPPAYNSFNNYWIDSWRMATIEAPAKAAEDRLHTWFGVMDRLVGAKFDAAPQGPPSNGAYLVSFATQLSVLQNVFLGRFDDYLKPYLFRVGTDKLQIDKIATDGGVTLSLNSRPYLYVPYCTMVLGDDTIHALSDYVNQGGRLIIEATSGFWSEKNNPNSLAHAFGLPEAVPAAGVSADSEALTWQPQSPFQGVQFAFRTREFEPPIERQAAPWINNIPRAFLRSYRWRDPIPEQATVIGRFADGSPAALLLKIGKGEVLYFCGTIDWIGCPGLNSTLDSWGHGQTPNPAVHGDPLILSQALTKGDLNYIVGRRFIGQDAISKLIAGTRDDEAMKPQLMSIVFPVSVLHPTRYHIHELLNAIDLGSVSSDELAGKGVSLALAPGQAFILEATPENAGVQDARPGPGSK